MKKFLALTVLCAFLAFEHTPIKSDDDDTPLFTLPDDQSESGEPEVIIIDTPSYPNYTKAQESLDTAMRSAPLLALREETLTYKQLDNVTRDNYLSALNYFHQFFTIDFPTTIDAAVSQSNEIITTTQYMIDLCINNLTWLSNKISDAVSQSTRQPYIENHNLLLKLGTTYETEWIKPTEQYVNTNWKQNLYNQFVARRDALFIYTDAIILNKLADVSSKITLSQEEYDHAKQTLVDAETRIKPYVTKSTITFEQAFNVYNGGSTYTAKDIWNMMHRAFAYISYHMQEQLANQMSLDPALFADPQQSSFDPKQELNNLISTTNPNIKKLTSIQRILQDTASAFNCLGCYTASTPLSCACTPQSKESISYSSDAQAGDDSVFAQIANMNVTTISALAEALNDARASQADFTKKLIMLSATKGTTWLNNHLKAAASFLSGFYNQQQGKQSMNNVQLPTLPLQSSYESLKNSLAKAQDYYEQAAYDYNDMLVKTSTATNINGHLVPDSWISYARDAQAVYDYVSAITNKLFINLKNLLNQLENIKQSSDNEDIQASWLKALDYAQQFDQHMQQLRANKGYKACNPFPWYESLAETTKDATKPLTAYVAKILAGPFWQTKIDSSCNEKTGCDDQGLNYVLYATSINAIYPYISDENQKKINRFISTSAGRLLKNAQDALTNAENVDARYAQQRADAESADPTYTENQQALSLWESAAKAAQFALNNAAETTRDQAITLYFTCMDAYQNSNIVRMHQDYLIKQIKIAYTQYAEAKKLGTKAPPQTASTDVLQKLLQPLWNNGTAAAQAYKTSQLDTEEKYNAALKNLDALATIQALAQQLHDTPLIDVKGTQYSVPLLPSLPAITLPDANLMQTRAQLYQNYGVFMLSQALKDQWDANGNRKLITNVTYSNEDITNNPQKIISQFVPIRLQKAASALNQARMFYQKASVISGSSAYAQLDTLNSLSTLAFMIFNTELTAAEPIAPTDDFNTYLPDMAGKVYTRYLLPSWVVPIPDEIYTQYADYLNDPSTYPDILADTLIENCGGLAEMSDADRTALRTEYIKTLKTLIATGTPTKTATYKLGIFVGQYGSTSTSYALFINNYPTLPITNMNMLNTTALETQGTLGIEAYVIGINRIGQYLDMEKRVPDSSEYAFIKTFINQRKTQLMQMCKSAQPSAAYMLYKQASYLTGNTLQSYEKQLLGIQTWNPLQTPPATINSLDTDGKIYYTALQNSPVKNLFKSARLFAFASQEQVPNVVLPPDYNAQLTVKTDALQQFIMYQYITFLQKYLVGNTAADNYQAVSLDIQKAFAEIAQIYKTNQSDSSSKDHFRALYDQQVQNFLYNAFINATDTHNKNYFVAANNLFTIVNLYDQYKINLTQPQRDLANRAGLTAIHYLFKGAAEKFINWYENRAKSAMANGCETFQTDLLDALIYYGLVSAIGATDPSKQQSSKNLEPCNQQQGDDRISFYRKIFGVSIPCPLPDKYTVCKRSRTDCTDNPQFQENNLLDGVSPAVNDYVCTLLKDTCDNDWNAYIYNIYVTPASPNSQALKNMLTGFVEDRLPYTLQRSGNTISITGSSSYAIDQSLADVQRWATRILSMIFGIYSQVVCKGNESTTTCRVNQTTNLANALAARKTAVTQSMSQLFRGSATITCSTTGGR